MCLGVVLTEALVTLKRSSRRDRQQAAIWNSRVQSRLFGRVGLDDPPAHPNGPA